MTSRFYAAAVLTAVFAAGVCGSAFAADGQEGQERFLPAEARVNRFSISEGIARVLRDSRLIRITLPDREMAFQDTLIARSALFPHLSASASKTHYRYQPTAKFGSAVVPTAEQNPFSISADVYQTVFDFGKSLAQYRASQELLGAQSANLEAVKRLAVLEFVTSYFDLLEAEKMIAVAGKEVESLTAYMKDVEQLQAQGAVVKNELLPVQVRLADAKQRLISARNARELAAAALNNQLALPLRDTLEVSDVGLQPPELAPLEEAWELAEGQRQELRFLEDMSKAALFGEKAAARENWPTVFVQGGVSHDQNNYLGHEDNAAVSVGAKMNLYEGGAEYAKVKKERARRAQFDEQRRKLAEDIKLEVEGGYLGLTNAGERVTVAKGVLEQADENVRVSRAKYAEGMATSTEVLEAITLQTGAQTNYYAADYELKRAYSRLLYSMGIDLALVYERMERGSDERDNRT
jgi:outer membrane protein TolC